ncbi:MAG TPA: DUF2911 domain-containing protein [Terriglobales bacterium]
MKSSEMLIGILFVAISVPMASAAEPQTKSAVCTLEDGKQVSLRYQLDDSDSSKLKMGQMWPQTDRPILLFSQTPLRIEDSSIPVGAFSVYIIPDKKRWTLVVNSNVAKGEYQPQQDLARALMVTGDVSGRGSERQIWFGHSAPDRCEFRFYDGKTGASVEFQENSRTGS